MSPMVMGEEKNHLSLSVLFLFQLLDTFHLHLPTVGRDCGVLLLLLVSYAGSMENINSSQISSGALSVSLLHSTGRFLSSLLLDMQGEEPSISHRTGL